MERHFEKDINELKRAAPWMGSLAERAVHQAVHAVLESDEPLARRVLEEEDAINELQLEIDDSRRSASCPAPAHGRGSPFLRWPFRASTSTSSASAIRP